MNLRSRCGDLELLSGEVIERNQTKDRANITDSPHPALFTHTHSN